MISVPIIEKTTDIIEQRPKTDISNVPINVNTLRNKRHRRKYKVFGKTTCLVFL